MEAAFFDLDKTVIAKASLLALGRTFFKEGFITRKDVIRSVYAQTIFRYLGATEKRLSKIQDVVSNITLGWEQETVIRVVTEALSTIVAPLIYQEAMDLMVEHRNAGRKIYLVSATPLEIVGPLADFIGVDGSIHSLAAIDAQGKYTGEMDFYAYGPFKVEAMEALAEKEGIDLANSYAYSDSYTDIPMLEAVGHPSAVNPDRVLAKHAREHGWPILEFSRTTRLTKSKRSKKAITVATASAVVGVTGAVVTAETLRRARKHAKANR